MELKNKMKNKVLVQLLVPDIGEEYNVYIPVNKKIGNVIILLTKAINEFEAEIYTKENQNCLYDGTTGERYAINDLVRNTNIRNGTKLILM